MAVALNKGLLDAPPNASSIVPVFCPSANCTFGESGTRMRPYTSVGICSDVRDITDQIRDKKSNFTLPSGLQLLGGNVLRTRGVLAYEESNEDRGLFDFEVIMVNRDCLDSPWTGILTGSCSPERRAFHVKMSPCIYTYASPTYSNHVFNEPLLSTTLLPYAGTSFASLWNYWSLVTNHSSSSPDGDCSASPFPTGRKTQLSALSSPSRLR